MTLKQAVAFAIAPTPRLTAWSFSRLMDFEKCAYMFRLKHIDKVSTDIGGVAAPNPYADRGIRIHTASEDYITGKTTVLDPDLVNFSAELLSSRERFKNGQVEVEGEWAFDNKWQACDWRAYDKVWVRIKLDQYVNLSDDVGLVIDTKTGKRFGNEIKHGEQGQLYAGAAFLRHPEKKKILVEMHYVDQPAGQNLSQIEYQPGYAAKALVNFEKRATKLLTATMYPPRPNIFNCRYCPYGKHKGNGFCKASA